MAFIINYIKGLFLRKNEKDLSEYLLVSNIIQTSIKK
jgi:hypothetical protein